MPCIGLTTAFRPPAPAPPRAARARLPLGQLGPGRLGDERGDVEAASVELDDRHALSEPSVRGRRHLRCPVRQLPRFLRELLRLDDAVAGGAVGEARMREQRAVEAEQRRHSADLVLVERAQHPEPRVLAVDAVHDQLRDHRVVQRRDLRAVLHARVHPHARPRRLAVARDPPGGREEAAGRVLGVDPALDRVAGQADVVLAAAIAALRPRSAPARGRGRGRSPSP